MIVSGCLLALVLTTATGICQGQFSEEEAREFIDGLNKTFSFYGNREIEARWNYITDITQEHEQAMNNERLAFQEVKKEATQNSSEYQWDSYTDEALIREAKFYYSLGNNLTTEQLEQMNFLGTSMESTYSTAKICDYDEDQATCVPSLELEPDLVEMFANSRNHEQLKHAWIEWRKASGNKYREEYTDFIEINNIGAKALGFADLKEQWLERYEHDDFAGLVDQVWTEEIHLESGRILSLELFYKQFHAYVRRKLINVYNEQGAGITKTGYIPAHLLGNMWAQQWDNIEELVKPFNDTTILDVTDAMVEQNYTVKKMFELAEDFFVSLGFEPMTSTFWEKSMLEKPSDRDVVCHASAEEFYKLEDFRIKMCTTITHADLVTIHHEMGHIEYFMEYKHQPFVYREAANPGFHEAIGDTMALAVNTPTHLQALGLLPARSTTDDVSREDIGYLFHVALQKLVFLPFAYTMDLWRWKLFTGEIDDTNMNGEWWKLRRDLQGLDAPSDRMETDFDPGSKYHIPANVPYVRYFVSFIVQFQFYEALCKKSGQYVENDAEKPLYLCDFSLGGSETGDLIRQMMEPGFSRPWPEALEEMTGTSRMSAESFLKYFLPLYDYLEQENANNGECVGWADDCEEQAKNWLDLEYETAHRELDELVGQKEWEYQTNINEATSAAAVEAVESLFKYDKEVWFNFVTQYNYETFADPQLKRRFKNMAILGVAALPEDRLSEFNQIVSNMTGTYGSGKVCPYTNQECDLESEGLTLEPGIQAVVDDVSSHSWEELEYYWLKWRDASGRQIRTQFSNYISLSNEAAVANSLVDASQLWLSSYTKDDAAFRSDLETIWEQMRPLYEKVHAYVRYRYRQYWGSKYMAPDEPIPAHIFGNMWAQQWHNTLKVVAPFPNVTNPLDEVNQALVDQNYSRRGIFELSNAFYTSLGLEDMEMCYDTPCGAENTPENHECTNNNPMIEKPNWDVVCHASAWDMYHKEKDDYRIKMCTEVDLSSLVVVHHEMGHIQYYLQYVDLPLQFRSGANNGFHEAIGDTMALAVQTPGHLQSVGLLQDVTNSFEADINYLLKSAMEKVVFLPFAYTIDQYRWALFDGTISQDELNYKWWTLREKYQGIVPPTSRSEQDFDAGAKYHVAADVPYIRYFAAHILEFMFYKEMCLVSEQYDPNDVAKPLYRCDFSNGTLSQAAGDKMRRMLQTGSSRPWPEILEKMTGTRKLDAGAMIEYFKPLSDWLQETIDDNGIPVGWKSTVNNYFPKK